jgi:hypothetical protein
MYRTLTTIDVSANEERFVIVFEANEVRALAPKEDKGVHGYSRANRRQM